MQTHWRFLKFLLLLHVFWYYLKYEPLRIYTSRLLLKKKSHLIATTKEFSDLTYLWIWLLRPVQQRECFKKVSNFLGLRHKSWQALKQDLVNSKIYKSDCKDKEKKRVTYIVFQHSPEQSHKLITRVFLAGVMKIVCPFYLHLLHGKSATEVGIQEVGHAVTLFSFCFLLRNREL